MDVKTRSFGFVMETIEVKSREEEQQLTEEHENESEESCRSCISIHLFFMLDKKFLITIAFITQVRFELEYKINHVIY